jgi:hypothetical protein
MNSMICVIKSQLRIDPDNSIQKQKVFIVNTQNNDHIRKVFTLFQLFPNVNSFLL